MDREKWVETSVGLFVAAAFAALFVLAMQVSNFASYMDREDTYRLTARFENVGGLKVRSPVSVAGVRVGQVTAIDFDNETFEAVVTWIAVFEGYDTDPTAEGVSAATTRTVVLGLDPGGEEDVLTDGDEIRLTQSALVLGCSRCVCRRLRWRKRYRPWRWCGAQPIR